MRALSPEDASLLRQSLPEVQSTEIQGDEEEPALDDLARRGLVRRSETEHSTEWVTTARGRLLLAASEGA